MIPIDKSEIEAWGRQFDAKGNFPKLIEKLIRETTPKSTSLQMPSGSAVYMGGWDGVVKCEEKTDKVPLGKSLWEIGTNGDETKANGDYKKRTENSLGFEKSEATYVFITTNVWDNKDNWAESKEKEGIWKNVIAYDSRDIAAWLENSPVSCRWFSVLTKNHPFDGIYNAEEYWKMISMGPKGQLPPKIVTAGRELQSRALLEFLTGVPAVKAVKGSTKEEAIAFIIATAMLFDNHPKELFFSRSVVVHDEHKFHGLRINKNAINLIANLDVTGQLYVAAHDNGHHVLVPLGPDDNFGSQDIIELPRIDRDGQVEALQEMGLSREEANKYSKEAGRDYTILKGLLGFATDESKWKYQDKVIEIIPALLIGRWDENKEGDRKIIGQLAGESFATYSEKLYKWLEVESSPLIKIGSSWRLTSPLDAWTNLSNYISSSDFESLKICFLEVMREVNPVLELEPENRMFASMRGKESIYSVWCREGLTQSMILVGLHGDKLKFQQSFHAQDWVDGIIKELLYQAPGDLWASRNHEMPLIAEASPKSFFESAYHSLSLDDKPIMDMFIEEDGFISPSSHHTGLLWALEGLAWTEEYVYDSSMLLAKLATLDPGGNLSNRPLNSLREIYKPWHYQTLASFEDRMQIVEQIIKKEYKTGWELLGSMIPDGIGGTAFPTHKLRWRLFERSFNNQYLWSEIFATHSRVLELMITYFDFSEKELIDLLDKSESKQIQPYDREKVLSFIEGNLDKIKITDNSAWHKLRGTLSHHRSYPDAQWALPEEQLKRYEVIYNKLEPSDSVERLIWMFNDHWPGFPEGLDRKELSHRNQEKLMLERRVEGLKSIYQEFGFEKVKELVKIVKETWIYGDVLAYVVDKEEEVLSLCEYLKEDEAPVQNFIQRFIFRKSINNGIDWVFDLYGKIKSVGYSDDQLSRMFFQVNQSKELWSFIASAGDEVNNAYWKGVYPHFWGLPDEDFIFGIEKLMEVNRFLSALDMVYHEPQKLPTEKLVDVLVKAGTKKSDEDRRLDSYHATRVIEELEKREDIEKSTLLHLEWLYLPFLASYGSGHRPKVLHEELANSPEFFMEVLNWVYKSDKEEADTEDISDEAKRNRGQNAYQLLSSWKRIPGVSEEGIIDESTLWDWINKVRASAEESGRLTVADLQIGKVLAEYREKEEPWPPKEICNVIETINTDSIKSGFSSATFNKRGSSSRGAFDGGNIERDHAEYFHRQAAAIKYEFPETAKILTGLAKGYEADAKRMDESAERDKLDH
ncbi:MAG: hypothetical protein RJQ00_08560 [Vicingaceae bacterium]